MTATDDPRLPTADCVHRASFFFRVLLSRRGVVARGARRTRVGAGYSSIALLDRDGVYGLPRFHLAATRAGLKPIVGAELTVRAVPRPPVCEVCLTPPGPAWILPLPLLVASASGLSQPVPADHAHEAARAERRGRAHARRARRLDAAGWWRSPAARRSTAGASASAACSIALVGMFGRDRVVRRAAASFPARRRSRQRSARRSGRGVSRADRRDQRRPLRDAGRAAALRRAHLHPPPHRPRAARDGGWRRTPSAI